MSESTHWHTGSKDTLSQSHKGDHEHRRGFVFRQQLRPFGAAGEENCPGSGSWETRKDSLPPTPSIIFSASVVPDFYSWHLWVLMKISFLKECTHVVFKCEGKDQTVNSWKMLFCLFVFPIIKVIHLLGGTGSMFRKWNLRENNNKYYL